MADDTDENEGTGVTCPRGRCADCPYYRFECDGHGEMEEEDITHEGED